MKRVLDIGGKKLRDEIKRLKRSGLKTEPAFAKLLFLDGDPYQAFLALEDKNTEALNKLISKPLKLLGV